LLGHAPLDPRGKERALVVSDLDALLGDEPRAQLATVEM
jgi:hypothetical protein